MTGSGFTTRHLRLSRPRQAPGSTPLPSYRTVTSGAARRNRRLGLSDARCVDIVASWCGGHCNRFFFRWLNMLAHSLCSPQTQGSPRATVSQACIPDWLKTNRLGWRVCGNLQGELNTVIGRWECMCAQHQHANRQQRQQRQMYIHSCMIDSYQRRHPVQQAWDLRGSAGGAPLSNFRDGFTVSSSMGTTPRMADFSQGDVPFQALFCGVRSVVHCQQLDSHPKSSWAAAVASA